MSGTRNYFSIQRLAHLLIVLFLSVYILQVSQSIIVPFIFAIIFALILQPIASKIENKISHNPISILLSFLLVLSPIVLLVVFLSSFLIEVIGDMPSIIGQIEDGFLYITKFISKKMGWTIAYGKEQLTGGLTDLAKNFMGSLGTGLTISSTLLLNFILIFIYTFLILLYRKSFKNFFEIQFVKSKRASALETLSKISKIIQKYLYGLGLVILILGVLNTIGLFLIGIEYALFWGFLAAILAIFPYVGTALGGLFPFMYALSTTDTFWQPLMVIVLFTVIQFVEGNLITPKVVGSSIKLNPLASILALFIGASIWGIAGLILALPILAIVRIIIQHITYLEPVSLLLSDDIAKNKTALKNKFDEDKYRLISFLKIKK